MDKKRFLQLILPLACLLIAGCGNDDDGMDGPPVAVQFGAGNIAGPETRTAAGGTQWVQGDPVGIFMVKNGQTLSSASIAEGADNVEYKANNSAASSGFSPAGRAIYYPQDGSQVDFIAYYPYQAPLTGYSLPIDVSDQTTPADIDVLYSNNATGYNKTGGTVDLQFAHALSKLNFTLLPGTGAPDLTGATIEISNLHRTADMDLADGSLINPGSQGTITANSSNYVIAVPQAASSSKLTITLAGNNKYEWDFPASTQWQTGLQYTYAITVSRTGITVSSSGITTWTAKDDPATPGTAQAGYKVGDYYPDPTAIYQNGVLISGTPAIGVVFWLDNQVIGNHPYNKVSQHGKIVGLYERATSNLDAACMAWVTNYETTYNAGTGWYIPAYGEKDYYDLYCTYNGMNYETWDTGKPNDISKNDTERTWFRKKITDAGGDNITDSWYWVSSVNGINNAYSLHFNSGNVEIVGNILGSSKTRAIKKF